MVTRNRGQRRQWSPVGMLRPKQQAREPQQNVRFSFGRQNFPPFVDNSIALRQSGPFRHPSQKGVQGLNRDLAPRGAGAVACR